MAGEMRVGIGQLRNPSDERLDYIRQLGVRDVIFNFGGDPEPGDVPVSVDGEWSVDELVALRERVESHDLRLEAIENFPTPFYDDVMLGREGRDEQLERVKTTVRNMGEAGIGVLGYNWMPNFVWRAEERAELRGGAKGTAFSMADVEDAPLSHGREYTEAELWENYEYFLDAVLPVAEEAGVRICVHPDDPPVESLGGVPRLFRNFENYKRAMALSDSPNHGVEFGLGVFSEMDMEASVEEVVRYFGERDRIFYVHFRDVVGRVPEFHETFVDEGNYDEWDVLCALDDVGFDGVLIPDHVPEMSGDSPQGDRGRGYAVGYLKGMLKVLRETRG